METTRIGIYSFDLKSEKNRTVHYTIDVSTFRDPMGNKALTNDCHNGRDQRVKDWIITDSRYYAIMESIESLAEDAKARKVPWLSIGIRDHHGKWASVALAEMASAILKKGGFDVNCVHCGLTY
jgi:RNase adaptor protein for sRNA GlmZ degradation